MNARVITHPTPAQLVESYKKRGSLKSAWKTDYPQMGWVQFHRIYKQAVAEELIPPLSVGRKTNTDLRAPEKVIEIFKGKIKGRETITAPLPKKGHVKRYLFTCAQNNTKIFEPFWRNLLVLKDHYDAELHISRFVYNTLSQSALLDKKLAIEGMSLDPRDRPPISWKPELLPYCSDDRVEVGPGLVWCGEHNSLPTSARPLNGFLSYTGRKSMIMPHVKIAMETVATSKGKSPKFCYTTGTVTERNYIQRAAGLKAEFHHCYGALLVEVNSDGDWYCRQINGNSEGEIYDLDVHVAEDGTLTTNNRVEAIVWGDVHVANIDAGAYRTAVAMLDELNPKYQYFHDVLDFRSASHHERDKTFMRFKRYLEDQTSVEKEVTDAERFINSMYRPDTESIVVYSNHHDHLGRWLQEMDGRRDPKNYEFWLKMQARCLTSMRDGEQAPNFFRIACEIVAGFSEDEANPYTAAYFLDMDEESIICPDPQSGGIECGMHGHAGAKGQHGSVDQFTKMGRKINIGDKHTATIRDGVYVAGVLCRLDPDWTTGPCDWSHSMILNYSNGKRAIITFWKNAFRAT